MTGILVRRGQSYSGRRQSCDKGGREWKEVSLSQGKSRAAGEARRGRKILPNRFQREHRFATALILNFWPPELFRQYISVVLSHPVCDPLLRKPYFQLGN